MRCPSIAVLCALAVAPTLAFAQADSHEVNEPPAAPTSRVSVEGGPTLFERLFNSQQPQPQAQPAAQQPADAAQARQRRRIERRAERTQRRAERRAAAAAAAATVSQRQRPARRERAQAAAQARPSVPAAQPGPVARAAPAAQEIPIPPPHPGRAAEQAIATVDDGALASAGADPTIQAYEASEDPRERCHVVLASEAEHDIAEILRCRVMMQR